MSEHAPLAPSSMARTVQCPGSVVMQRGLPDDDGPEAREGVAAHWAVAEVLEGRSVAVGQIAPNGVMLTDEMIEGADLMFDAIPRDAGPLSIEKRVDCSALHPQCWGTPDVHTRLAHRRVQIYDYKFGHGFVEVFENWQLMTYAAGVLRDYQLYEADDVVVEFFVVQPRSYHRDGPLRKWSVLSWELRPYWGMISGVCHLALAPTPPNTFPGPECRHCKASNACTALQRAALSACDVAGTSVSLDLPTTAAANEKRRIDYAISMLEARSSGLNAQLLQALRTGQHVPHFHVEHGQGREVWAIPDKQVRALGGMFGVSLEKPGVLTPSQARKLGVDTDAALTVRGTGEAKLVADEPHRAAKFFGGHQHGTP